MDYLLTVVALLVTASSIYIHLLTRAKKPCPAKLPPGSLGLPVIGQTFGFVRAIHANSIDRWIRDRMNRYGPVSKALLFGTPTVLLAGPAANKFIFFSSLLPMLPRSVQRVVGEKNVVSHYGDNQARIRGALLRFLEPDMLKLYVGTIDAGVRRHLEENWSGGRTTVTVLPLMKRLTFDIFCVLLFGLETGAVRDALSDELVRMFHGMLAIPVNLPFTAFGRSLRAGRRCRRLLHRITREKKAKLGASPNNDLISQLLSITDDHGEQLLTNEEIVDSSVGTLIAGHDTTSTLLTFMVRQLANDPATLSAMVQEHEEIAKNKADGEALAWEDLSKMKFTWRVAQETLRIIPPVFGSIRVAIEDIEFHGYCIPKGWQVLWAASMTQMDPSIFHEPAKFDPSRFESQSSARPPCSFVAWGGRRRICPGIEFAKIETLVTMHYLVRQFRWKLCYKENTFVRTPLPVPLHGLPIELEHKTSLSPFECDHTFVASQNKEPKESTAMC
ncbi:taxane 13-alpha-hydroxylase-like [Lolium rigidum]|uniref:taxane 13-alpha-hydroxylase-like n=1 Tax=Lolium rigidum TaxID=89674 RepID=UPI001F5C5E0E|nr:taxane 13-alpha-hydroxylase-like [Lolium rigidum]